MYTNGDVGQRGDSQLGQDGAGQHEISSLLLFMISIRELLTLFPSLEPLTFFSKNSLPP